MVKIHLDKLLLGKIHAMASQTYRKNNIASLKSDVGEIITDHHQMAGIALNKF
jgi:hypothetical protein